MKIPLAKLLVLLWMHLRETLSHLNSSPTLTMTGRWDVVVERKEDWVENLPSVLLSERETTWRRRLSEERDQVTSSSQPHILQLGFTQTMNSLPDPSETLPSEASIELLSFPPSAKIKFSF